MSDQLVKTNYKIFKRLSKARIKEAKILLKNNFNSGAYYLAGYSVEFALKAYYCKQMMFPPRETKDLYNHDLNTLFQSCGLKEEFEKDIKNNKDLGASFGSISQWSVEARYKIFNRDIVVNFIDAIINKRKGVLTWIMKKI